jgi:hypothetical protein
VHVRAGVAVKRFELAVVAWVILTCVAGVAAMGLVLFEALR